MMQNISKRGHPNLGTFNKIQELAAYREQHIKETGKVPFFIPACQKIVIGHRTVKRQAPELVEKWKDLEFHW
jgi:hypothetical protein